MKTIISEYPEIQKDLKKSFADVYEFAIQEIKNYKHYANFENYYRHVQDIEEEKTKELDDFKPYKYISEISYKDNKKEIQKKEDEISR